MKGFAAPGWSSAACATGTHPPPGLPLSRSTAPIDGGSAHQQRGHRARFGDDLPAAEPPRAPAGRGQVHLAPQPLQELGRGLAFWTGDAPEQRCQAQGTGIFSRKLLGRGRLATAEQRINVAIEGLVPVQPFRLT
jgi:hypothetical protein